MPVFVSTTFAPNQSSVVDVVRLLSEHDIFNIELGSIHRYEDGLSHKLQEMGCNYITHNFFPPISERLILNIASTDERIRQKSIEFIKHAIEFSERISADIYTIHPGFLIDPAGESSSDRNYDFDFSPGLLPSYSRCFEVFFRSLSEIANYVEAKRITIAVETQGSVSKKHFLLLSKPENFSTFLKENKNSKIGINLNFAHLNLAANALVFDKYKLVEMLKPMIVAVEVSHNEGLEDDHQALRADGWYKEVLNDGFFRKIPVIFEGRNLPISKVVRSYNLLRDILE